MDHSCIHCGRKVEENQTKCPYCKKNPNPPPKPQPKPKPGEEQSPLRYRYQVHFVPAESSQDAASKEKARTAQQIIEALTQGPDSEREHAIDFLLNQNRNMTKDIITAFENPEIAGKEHLAKALGRMGSRPAIPVLINALGDPNRSVRLAAAWALYRINDPKALKALLEYLDDKDPQMRQYLTYALGGWGDPKITPRLTDLTQDPDPLVREQAILSLAFLQGGNGLAIFRKAKKDSNERVRKMAAELLRLFDHRFINLWKIGIIICVILIMVVAGILIYRWKLAKG